ncbi:hypothetical protein [Sphingomonas sp. CCH16-B10]|uniref:hypothetical protein n=1 Tax=Sphingomonas sp. CCH16-B10 TaxID=1768755 RepID=UPI000834C7BE|nr:hypothetical protein [Sphingomonas sp. CCH16-B10]
MASAAPRRAALWLGVPGRYAHIGRRPALGIVLAVMLCCLLLAGVSPPENVGAAAGARDAIELNQSITDAMRGGESYYPVTARRLREAGLPLRPFTAFHLPTLNVLHAAVPADLVRMAYWLVAGLAGFAWAYRLQAAFRARLGLFTAMALLASGLTLFTISDLHLWPEAWAGTLIALSMARWRPGRAVEAAGYATMALMIRELAALYPIVMALAALHSSSTASAAIGFPLLLLVTIGWSEWQDPLGVRVAALAVLLLVVIALFAPAGAVHWAAIATPVLLVGGAFLPDLIRDLARAILDMRRVRVHRVTR